VAWPEGPKACLDIHHVIDRDGKWTPDQTLLPVPVGREEEAREVLESR